MHDKHKHTSMHPWMHVHMNKSSEFYNVLRCIFNDSDGSGSSTNQYCLMCCIVGRRVVSSQLFILLVIVYLLRSTFLAQSLVQPTGKHNGYTENGDRGENTQNRDKSCKKHREDLYRRKELQIRPSKWLGSGCCV